MNSQTGIDRIMAFVGRMKGLDAELVRDALTGRQLHRRLEHQLEEYLHEAGLSASRFEVLEALYHHPEQAMTPAELAEEVMLTRAAMTGCLDGLEQAGYVKRTPNPRDRRSISVELTARGRRLMDDTLEQRYRDMAAILECLKPAERKRMISYYHRLVEAIEAVIRQRA